jgi:hypothetical protein
MVANVEGNVTGNVTGDVTGDVTGNADTATALATGRTISLTGDVTGTSASFDGSGNVNLAATIAANSVALGTDTTGNYMSDLTEGTGIDITHTPAEGSNATITLDLTEVGFGGGANRLITDDGDGTVSTESQLTYNGAGQLEIHKDGSNAVLQLRSDDANTRIHFKEGSNLRWNVGYDAGNNKFSFYDGSTVFAIEDGAGANTLILDSNSRVGIGTSSPAQKVDISDTRPVLRLTDSSSGTIDTAIGTIEFYSEDTSGNYPAVGASIKAMTESSFGSGHGLAFSTNGDSASPTERMRITDGGNVGIGTGSPSNTLEVKSSSSTPFAIKNASNSTRFQVSLTNDDADIFLYDRNTTLQTALRSEGDSYFNQGNVGIGVSSPSAKLEVNGDIEISPSEPTINLNRGNGSYSWKIVNGAGTGSFPLSTFNIANNAGTPVITALDSGNVGIGTAHPASPLEVNGNVAFGDTATGIKGTIHSTDEYRINAIDVDENGYNSLHLRADGTDGLFIQKDTNNVGIGTNSPTAKLDVRGNVSFFSSDASDYVSFTHSDNGIIINSAGSTSNKMTLNTGGSTALTIDASQNVGIGTASPSFKLKVNVDNASHTDWETIAAFQTKRAADSETEAGIMINSLGDALGGQIGSNYYWSDNVAARGNTGRSGAIFGMANNAGTVGNHSSFYWQTSPNNSNTLTDRMELDKNGNLKLFDNTANPSASAENAFLFCDSGELKVLDDAGHTTTISPHNFDLIPGGASEERAWGYYSEKDIVDDEGNVTTTQKVNVDMMKLARLVEELTGEKLVYTEED